MHGSPAPTFYLRTYPPWARCITDVDEELKEVSEDIICEILGHMVRYLQEEQLQQVISECSDVLSNTIIRSVDELSSACITMEKDKARTMMSQILFLIPFGKRLESLAIFKDAVSFDGITVRKPVKQTDSSAAKTSNEATCMSQQNFHSYCAPSSKERDHSYCTEQLMAEDGKQVHPRGQRKEKTKKCTKVLCKKKVKSLEDKIRLLQQELSQTRQKVRQRTLERNNLQQQVSKLTKENNSKTVQKLSVDVIKSSDALVTLHTGLPSFSLFQWVFNEVCDAATSMKYWKGPATSDTDIQGAKPGPKRTVSLKDELLVTLMKLKLNMSGDYLAYLFGLSSSTISTIISTWIPLLSKELQGLIYWPSRQEVALCYPQCFRPWPGITAILDCFEIPTDRPSHVEANTKIFSSYKNRPTVKFLLACTPGGTVSFISPPAGGNMSDKELVLKTNILQKFRPGDKCMVDKGFKIQGELLEHGVEIIIPPFVKKGQPFTDKENIQNKKVAHSRIHVERVIGRVRVYEYLNGIIPINQLDLIGPAAVIACALTNLKNSVMFKK